MVLTMTMTLDQDHGQRNDATVWKYETQWPSMTVVYAKQLPAVDIGAGPISEEGNPGKANGHSSLHTQSQHNSSSLNFNLLSSLPVNTANFQVSLQKKNNQSCKVDKSKKTTKLKHDNLEEFHCNRIFDVTLYIQSSRRPDHGSPSSFNCWGALSYLTSSLFSFGFFVLKKNFLLDSFVAKF